MIGAIVLGAGRSTRMGSQKLLLPLGESTVIATIVDQILAAKAAGIEKVVVVVSANGSSESIGKALAPRPITLVTNPDPLAEMLSSVRCGLRAMPANCKAALVALGDQPSIRADLIGNLVASLETSGKGIAVPIFGGRRGHPLLIASKHFPAILSQYDGVGLRGLLEAHTSDVLGVECKDAAILDDMDEPADYQRELRRHLSR